MARRPDDAHDVSLIIHGHFYQPPRENPWLESIQREPSADPYPNWNSRIADECYRANGWARVFDDEGRALHLVNNYLYLSFNMGPTLLSWMERHQPDTYERILEADRQSVALRSGHGNAIAQAYNHPIMPLCNDRDRLTQIRWGVNDFQSRFRREPEALWLPETGVDAATVEDLIAEGMTFLLLSPRQALRVRELGQEAWRDVSSSKVNPRRPYRLFSRRDPERYIDVFFYDGPVSHAISFEKVLHSSSQLVEKLWGAVNTSHAGPQLVHCAVDGETFGHHMRHSERALSYTFTDEAPKRGFKLTNYGEYLATHPPAYEVELDYGPGGEGTAWSCAHGVGRWYRDCSCHAMAPEGWNQAWRDPLRRAVNLVRNEAARLFEEEGAELLHDPWAARDDYVALLLDGGSERRDQFLERHCRDRARMTQQVRTLKLLEMQRHSLLAQTSCGWFFNDISGLEAVQVLKYAARTVQLIEELSGRSVEARVLEVLAEARSNIPEQGTGADVYRSQVLSASVDIRRLVAQYVITGMFREVPKLSRFFSHQIHRLEARRLTTGPVALSYGRLQVESLRTGENELFTYALIHFGGHDFHCAVRAFAGMQDFRQFTSRLEQIFDHATITELLRAVDAHFGEAYYGLPHLLAEEREEVLDALFGHLTDRFAESYTRLYQENRRAVNALIDTGLKVPSEFRIAAEYTLARQLNEEIRAQRRSKEPDSYSKAMEILAEATERGYRLDLTESEELFGEMLFDTIQQIVAAPAAAPVGEALELLGLAERLKIALPLDRAQNLLFGMNPRWGRGAGPRVPRPRPGGAAGQDADLLGGPRRRPAGRVPPVEPPTRGGAIFWSPLWFHAIRSAHGT